MTALYALVSDAVKELNPSWDGFFTKSFNDKPDDVYKAFNYGSDFLLIPVNDDSLQLMSYPSCRMVILTFDESVEGNVKIHTYDGIRMSSYWNKNGVKDIIVEIANADNNLSSSNI